MSNVKKIPPFLLEKVAVMLRKVKHNLETFRIYRVLQMCLYLSNEQNYTVPKRMFLS